ncbi:MAG: NAD(P)/FAD-dependent oxidoreductase [Defluviitaleaceae bacterium]|nr:NAD(P)/FAD-dependent oxidoreductase [Defluviitaleaceae bacterium]MCL2276095.1 NAD(P)/FAD-dependent oxidoreductase [Defluviitaleaceae bacterium]
MKKPCIVIIGGGPAGMMAAIAAASHGNAHVILLEKNEKLGKKLHLTGKGRCNLTNASDNAEHMRHILRNPRFLYSALDALDSAGLMDFFTSLGVPLKIERGKRVFPESDKANDINQALAAYLQKLGVAVKLRCMVNGITGSGLFCIRTNQGTMDANALILATGGLSYPSTGATGEGFSYAQALGHSIVPTFPSLVPLLTAEPWIPSLAGLSLRNVRLSARIKNKVLYEEQGEILFTHEGISGPLLLRASAYLADKMHESPALTLDLKPALDTQTLDARILRDFAEQPNKDFANALGKLLPARLINAIVEICGIPPETKINAITKTQRATLVHTLKNITIMPTVAASYNEAVITRGGISIREINPSTLMSKLVPNLFFAGECIDVDALTGGFNLQIAFSTGHLAGVSAAKCLEK